MTAQYKGGVLNFENRTLYHKDNLNVLRGINSETVHLIATDPPFNKNRDFHATPDSLASGAKFQDRWRWDKDAHAEWQDSIKDDWPAAWNVITAARAAYGDDMGAFLCWLGVRLMEMWRVLRQDGSIYLHIDHTAHAWVKCLMDAIFGWKNFRNEIVWCYSGPANVKRYFPRKHDSILFYAKSDSTKFFRDSVRVPYAKSSVSRAQYGNTPTEGMKFSVRVNNPLGKIPEDWWADIFAMKSYRTEITGYPTQKPLALYRRIIEASSNGESGNYEGDIVLDPFCGCATTCVAAEQLKRRWIGIDIWDEAYTTVLDRLQDEWLFTSEKSQTVMFPHEVHYTKNPPSRTDGREMAAPNLRLKIRRPESPWQRMTHKQMVQILETAQKSDNGVICAGCGRVLEVEFMHLDHITPKSERGENHILNRILLCAPCNGRKRDNLTLRGLLRQNKKDQWMRDENLAKLVQGTARDKAEWVRNHFNTQECKDLIDGKIDSTKALL